MNRLRTNAAISDVFTNFAHSRWAPGFADVVSGLCATVPAVVLTRDVLKGRTEYSCSPNDCDKKSPAANAKQEYLRSWQREMESFDRF